jgi:hypothetical protein
MFKKKRKDYSCAIVSVVGDIHANSTVAVCPPRVPLDRGGKYEVNRIQQWLFREVWEPYWDKIWKKKKRLKWPLITVLGGEAADDNKYAKTELISHNPADQLRIPMTLLKTALEISDFVVVIRGTEAHTGPSSWMDEKIAEDITGDVHVVRNIDGDYAQYNFRGYLGGVYFDIAHHPAHAAHRPWTKGGDAGRLAADMLYRYAELNKAMKRQGTPELQQELPDIVIRGHNHKASDSHDTHPIRAIINASWQLTSGFGFRLGGAWLPVGGLHVLCEKGQFKVRKSYMHWPIDPYWSPAQEEQ